MRKWISLLLCFTFLLCGCSSESVKKEYEALNGTTNSEGVATRMVSLPDKNPFVLTTAEDILKRMNNGETFFAYYGDPLCPWCRSVIEKASEVAAKSGITEIYTVNIWDQDGNEILRDRYELVEGKLTKTMEGTDTYEQTLVALDYLLDDYTITDDHGTTFKVGEKRIYAPNFVYIENGKAVDLVDGISENQEKSHDELTKQILQDEEDIFTKFFKRQ